MKWLILRQHRIEFMIMLGASTVIAFMFFNYGSHLQELADQENFSQFQMAVSAFPWAIPRGIPFLIGLFIGAPLFSRELESGMLNINLTQSITHRRWFFSKAAGVGFVVLLTVAIISIGLYFWFQPVDQVLNPWDYFDIHPIVYTAYTIFAFVLAVFLGMLIGKQVPAMAVSLPLLAGFWAGFAWLRQHYMLPITKTVAASEWFFTPGKVKKDFIVNYSTVNNTGGKLTFLEINHICPITVDGIDFACFERQGWLSQISFHPIERFLTFQWIEAGILIILTVILISITWLIFKRKLT